MDWSYVRRLFVLALCFLGFAAFMLSGCAPQQQSPPITITVTVNGEREASGDGAYRPQNAHQPIVISDALFGEGWDREKPEVATAPPVVNKISIVAPFPWLKGQTGVADYNSRNCLRTDWPDHRSEETVKATIQRGLDYHGAKVVMTPGAHYAAIVCLSNVRDGHQEIPNNGGYVERYVALVDVQLIDSGGTLVARGKGESRYYHGQRACWYQDAYLPKGSTCVTSAFTAFQQAAYRAGLVVVVDS